jgi:hypothetical protein
LRNTEPERKKNLARWLDALDFGFDLASCRGCKSGEDGEFTEQELPCKNGGVCKLLNHVKSHAPRGYIPNLLDAGGLADFDYISNRIINLSKFDGAELPSVDFYSNACGSVYMDEELFQDLLQLKLMRVRKSIIDERIKRRGIQNSC